RRVGGSRKDARKAIERFQVIRVQPKRLAEAGDGSGGFSLLEARRANEIMRQWIRRCELDGGGVVVQGLGKSALACQCQAEAAPGQGFARTQPDRLFEMRQGFGKMALRIEDVCEVMMRLRAAGIDSERL